MSAGLSYKSVTFEEGADILEKSVVENRLDVGHSLVYGLLHPVLGSIVLFSSTIGKSVVVS
jgi:hypothetical protein